ncbi:MAG TPA: DUF2760 domain-containing protein [Chthoniobacterales bacterium]
MKPYLVSAGVLLAVLNGLLLLPKAAAYAVPIAAAAVVLAVLVVVLSLSGSSPRARETPPPVAAEPRPPAIVQPPGPTTHRAEAEVVAFVALLQQGGRFVDFLMEDLTSYSDDEVGAAARVVHQGCRQVLQDNFKVIPIAEADEGSEVTVPAGDAAVEYRLLGNVSGNPPFTGKLIHKGWKTTSVKLPRLVQTERLPAIAPAEVELK